MGKSYGWYTFALELHSNRTDRPKKMQQIDIVIIATRRHALLERMINSFSEKVFSNFDIGKVWVNIDPIWGDESDQVAIKKLLNQTFPDVTIFEPQKANFSKAVKTTWMNTSADTVMHLEEDWIALENITPGQVFDNLTVDIPSLSLMHEEKNWNGKQIYHYPRSKFFGLPFKFEDGSRPHFSTSPSFWLGDFLRDCAKHMDIKFDPEKQFYDNINLGLQKFVSKKKCKFLIGQPNLVEDIGRLWRKENHIEKIYVNGVSSWINTK